MFEYKGYFAIPEVDTQSGTIGGAALNLRDTIHFEGNTVEEARLAFQESVDDYLEACKEWGKPPEKAYSGQISLRTTPELHKLMAVAAAHNRQSLNSWLEQAARNILEGKDSVSEGML